MSTTLKDVLNLVFTEGDEKDVFVHNSTLLDVDRYRKEQFELSSNSSLTINVKKVGSVSSYSGRKIIWAEGNGGTWRWHPASTVGNTGTFHIIDGGFVLFDSTNVSSIKMNNQSTATVSFEVIVYYV